jgi:antirestriction protein ArdC
MKPVTKDIYEIVTALIIEKLEAGCIPWKQPWSDIGPPRNLISTRPYRGVNLLLLSNLGYPTNEFLTFKQAKDLGASIKQGAKAHLVILWHWIEEKHVRHKKDPEPLKKPILRYYHVFNVDQCNNVPERFNGLPARKKNNPIEECEQIVANIKNRPNIVHVEPEAFYHTLADYINMPRMELFHSSEEYYACLFHELIHSTGHESRLNRKELTEASPMGSESYSIEELTAEIGSCYLTSYAGIAPSGISNHVSYINEWLKRLKKDKRFIVYASAQAQKATDYILNIKHDENAFVDDVMPAPNNEPQTRKLKVYYGHTGTYRRIPVIRLRGDYLSKNGFKIGDIVNITLQNNNISITKNLPGEADAGSAEAQPE